MEKLKDYFAGSYTIRILLGALYATIVADGLITRFLIHNGLAREGNPFLHFWVETDAFLTIKLVGGALATLYLWFVFKRHPRISIICTSLSLAMYTMIIVWNIHILLI